MSDPDEDASAEDVPDDLQERLDSLDTAELHAVLSYVEGRLESLQSSLEQDIEAEASGEIVDIEDQGGYAIVQMRPADPETADSEPAPLSLYHVRRERLPGEEANLHWSYLGEVHDPGESRCKACGRAVSVDVAVCPYCGSDEIERSETEG